VSVILILLQSGVATEMMRHMSRDHESWVANDGNHVMVPNLNEMISIITLVTRHYYKT
jgi:hypothetical protein